MRNGVNSPATDETGTEPAPPICGVKNRAATLDITTYAVNPCRFVRFVRAVKPGILELCHSIGKVIGVLPSTLKSYPLCVYFQMYSPSKTMCLPNACCNPAWNSLRKPGLRGERALEEQSSSGLSTGEAQ